MPSAAGSGLSADRPSNGTSASTGSCRSRRGEVLDNERITLLVLVAGIAEVECCKTAPVASLLSELSQGIRFYPPFRESVSILFHVHTIHAVRGHYGDP